MKDIYKIEADEKIIKNMKKRLKEEEKSEIKTVKQLRKLISNKKLNDFMLEDFVKFFAINIEKMTIGEELAWKNYLRKGADLLDYKIDDLQAVYNSYRNNRD